MPLGCYPISLADYPNSIFVETGSFNGSGIETALKHPYTEIHSVEWDAARHAALSEKFAAEPRVKLYQGDSADRLREIIPALNHPATFWLDAHDDKQSPLMEELIAIRELSKFKNTILIDDLNWFYCWKFTEDDIVKLVKTIDPNYVISKVDGAAHETVLVATPPV